MKVSLVRNATCSALLLACLTACNTDRGIGFTGSWDEDCPYGQTMARNRGHRDAGR